MVTAADVVTALSAISSIAVIAGAGFIVVQLRQNANLLNASLRQEKKNAAYSMLERLTNESFAKRRAHFYEVIEKVKKGDWAPFDDSVDDFEIRDFSYFYELYGLMVREKMVDFPMVANMMQYMVSNDWKEFRPVSEHYRERLGIVWWRNFEWLAAETEKYMSKREPSESARREAPKS